MVSYYRGESASGRWGSFPRTTDLKQVVRHIEKIREEADAHAEAELGGHA